MLVYREDGATCNCEKSQLDTMKAAGWSTEPHAVSIHIDINSHNVAESEVVSEVLVEIEQEQIKEVVKEAVKKDKK